MAFLTIDPVPHWAAWPDEWVTQLLRQGDAKVFKKYSQMKLQMKREALAKLNRLANEAGSGFGTAYGQSEPGFGTVLAQ